MDPMLVSSEQESSQTIHKIRHGFEVGSYALLIKESTRAEVVKAPAVCAIPSTPDWFAGFINHRGETVPVYNLDKYLQILDEQSAEQSWVLLIDDHPNTVGVLLRQPPQSIIDPVELDQDAAGLPEVIKQAAGTVWQYQEQQWLEVDHHRLFMALKKQF